MPEPTKIPRPFADSGDKNSIPDSSGGLGFASWQEGFPAITGTPFAQGGVAPKRADFNGVFNALSAAVIWAQQGGVYAYDSTTDYEIGNIAEKSGIIFICKTANGPSSSVKDPAADTTETYWARLYPQSGTFNRMFFSQTSGSYTAPYTGVYRITLKGGGGGGGGATDSTHCIGSGGGEGGTLTFYTTLTKNQSYAFVIGAGGAGGANGSTYGSADITNGNGGGSTSFNNQYSVAGGERGLRQQTGGYGGAGGSTYTVPTGAVVFFKPGAHGENGHILPSSYTAQGGRGGGCSFFGQAGIYGSGGNGGGRGSLASSATGFLEPTAGGDGYIIIEYAG